MSWIENIKTEFSIKTGDGKVYRPYWLNANKSVEYNLSVFEFIKVAGSYAARGLPKGTTYGIEIIFQGENHLVEAQAFDQSNKNTDPWVIQHPFYGEILAQPASLTYDNTEYNVSRITGLIHETIRLDQATASEIHYEELIITQETELADASSLKLAGAIPVINTKEKISIKKKITEIYSQTAKRLTKTSDATNYLNGYNKLMGSINSATSSTIEIGRAMHTFTVLPYTFIDTVDKRVAMFETQYNLLRSDIQGLFTRRSKKTYETQGSFLLSGAALSVITNVGNAYEKAISVFSIIARLNNFLNTYLQDLDYLQSTNGGEIESYIPDPETVGQLMNVVSTSISYLQTISRTSLQERKIFVNADTTLLLLTSSIYGLDKNDSNLNKLIEQNNISLEEYLVVKKGREIKYYV